MSNLISKLIQDLQEVPATRSVTNPYQVEFRRNNLESYLQGMLNLPYSGHLLVGEAPGYRGCAQTGIPFTSPHILRRAPVPALQRLWTEASADSDVSEATATITWNFVQTCEILPAFWNVFPFHPHQDQRQSSNRRPRSDEINRGRCFLALVTTILKPHTLIAVGRTAEKALTQWYPARAISYVRHPSHGGKVDFIAGLTAAGVV